MLKFVTLSLLFLLLVVMGQARRAAVREGQEHTGAVCCYTPMQHPWEETLIHLLANRFGDLPQTVVSPEACDTLSKLKVISQLRKEWEYLGKLPSYPVLAALQDFHLYGRCAIDYYIYTLRRIVI